MKMKIQMVDLYGQYLKIKEEVDCGIAEVIGSSAFINGTQVGRFASNLSEKLGCRHVITCANGTDALQIALMALGLQPGDEVIVPAFTYVASAEVIGLLGLTPVLADVDYDTFNITAESIEKAMTPRTRAVIPVHLYGQPCNMEQIMEVALRHDVYVIEDNAQSLGSECSFSGGVTKYSGTIGHFGCTSFFPSKNLGCYGDGGALFTDDDALAQKAKMIANHGQKIKYCHEIIGCNSRLDTIQAVVLDAKLKHLDEYNGARRKAAGFYNEGLAGISQIELPKEAEWGTHVYHQYTIKVKDGRRDALKEYLAADGIPSMIYYPLPLQAQKAFIPISRTCGTLDVSAGLCGSVLSLPMHTELTVEIQQKIIGRIRDFFK